MTDSIGWDRRWSRRKAPWRRRIARETPSTQATDWDRPWSRWHAPWRRRLRPLGEAVPARRLRLPAGGIMDALSLVAAVALVALGAANLDAVSGRPAAVHQLVSAALGVVALGAAYLLASRWSRVSFLDVLGWGTYGVAVVSMAAVLLVGVRVNGARRWITAGGFTFQPSDLALLGLLLVLASVLGSDRPAWRRVGLSVVLAAVPVLLAVAEPDLSTAALLVALAVGMLILGRAPLRLLAPILALGIALIPLVVGVLRPYQLSRLRSFLAGGPAGGAHDWALLQGHIALASGGVFGIARQPLHGLLATYLPTSQTDLAFVSLVEEWGLVAGLVALAATALIVWRAAAASRNARTPAAALVAGGLALLLGVEAVISLAGSLGFIPLAGIPYPLLSEGGSSAVIYLAALGVVLGVRRAGARRRLAVGVPRRRVRPRGALVAALGCTALMGSLGGYIWHFQQADGAQLRQTGLTEMTRCVALPAPRGVITDRHGVPLALDAPEAKVAVAAALLARHPEAEARLASLMGRAPGTLRTEVSRAPSTDLSLTLGAVSSTVAQQVRNADLPGVLLLADPARVYPYGPLLAPLLGFVGVATPTDVARTPGLPPGAVVGRSGLEEEYDALLRGVNGEQCFSVDPAGVPIAVGPSRRPVPGAALVTSLDLGLQAQLTASLAAMATGSDLGGAVALDPTNGQVLAMASVPAYTDNLFGPPVDAAALSQAEAAPGLPMLEHATQTIGPPGSAFKLVVASADIADGVVNPSTVVPTGGSYTIGGATFDNWAALGPMDLPTAIAWSNDVYFYKLAVALGPTRIDAVAKALGVGQPTGIDLPGEDPGYLETPTSVAKAGGTWYLGATVILGIGQGSVAATPLQVARWTAGVATGATVTPRLGLSYTSSGGPAQPLPATAPTALPFAAALGVVRQGMQQAVYSGIDTAVANLPVPVEAKTGTAQDTAAPGGSDAWFTAAAPATAPSVVVTAFVQGGSEGNTVAGPVVDQAMAYYFAHQPQITSTVAVPGG